MPDLMVWNFMTFSPFIPDGNFSSHIQFLIMEATVVQQGLCLLACAIMSYYSLNP